MRPSGPPSAGGQQIALAHPLTPGPPGTSGVLGDELDSSAIGTLDVTPPDRPVNHHTGCRNPDPRHQLNPTLAHGRRATLLIMRTSRSVRLGWAADLTVAAMVVAGCGENAAPVGDSAPDDGPVIALTSESSEWPAGIVTGRLTQSGGCLLIGRSVAVFPLDTEWDAPAVIFPGGERIEVGEHVRLGGGGAGVAGLTADGLPVMPVAEVRACAQRAGVADYVWAAPTGS